MTVGELIEQLENHDPDMEVMIGMYQTYGSDFVYSIPEIQERHINGFWGVDDNEKHLLLIEGGQVGTIRDNDDDWDD